MLQWEKGLCGQLATAQLEELALTSGATPPPAPGNVHPAAWKTTDKVNLGSCRSHQLVMTPQSAMSISDTLPPIASSKKEGKSEKNEVAVQCRKQKSFRALLRGMA